jgi:glutamyl-Q tRNA(Asp) synthetase
LHEPPASSPAPEYRGRFAPSPTGPLHLGSLSTALASYVQAKAWRGRWLLRIDDLDPPRTVPGAADQIMGALEALGLHWDGPALFQSRRQEAYAAALERLAADGLVYPCWCSRKDLAGTQTYPGHCRRRTGAAPPGPCALRIDTTGARIAFEDALQGPVAQNLETEVCDFILYRRDRVYAYHLATVLDDAAQGVTEVLRGIDLLDSTPRQIFLERLLGLPAKGYAHAPVLVERNGQKLSKQNLAPAAAVHDPGGLLLHLLGLLKQAPPAELAGAPAPEVLAWATAHWNPKALKGMEQITVDAGRFADKA